MNVLCTCIYSNFFLFLSFQEGEHVAKLEKADILELTVRHLQKLRHQDQLAVRPDQTYIDRFRAGFKHCATEVTHFIGNVDHNVSNHLMKHLNTCIRRLDGMQPLKEVTPMQARPRNLQSGRPQQPPPAHQHHVDYHQSHHFVHPTQIMQTTHCESNVGMWRPW